MQLDPTTDESFTQFLPGRQQEDDRALIVEFFVGKKLMGAKSKAAGREIYEDREYIRIYIKGQDKQVAVHEVTDQYRQKYPNAYQRFRLQKPAPVVGTPIEQLPGVGPSLAHHLKGINIRTIEDLAGCENNETALANVGMGARELVKKAKAFLSQTDERTVALEQENAALKQQLADLTTRVSAMEKPKRKYTRKQEAVQ